MSYRKFVLFAILVGFGAACESGTELIEPVDAERSQHAAVSATAAGGGHFLVTIGDGAQGQFAFNGVQEGPDGAATGNFRYSLEIFGALLEFHGRTTCMTVDAENGRAWIGGVITQNNSTHPAWLTDVHEPGDAIWFRVVDYGEGAGAQPDRTTFVGFEGNAGIITSQEYCDLQIWPEDDARTWAVVNGDIQLGP